MKKIRAWKSAVMLEITNGPIIKIHWGDSLSLTMFSMTHYVSFSKVTQLLPSPPQWLTESLWAQSVSGGEGGLLACHQ